MSSSQRTRPDRTSRPARPAAPRVRPRVALYGHDTQGLGHLRRNLALAGELAGQADVLVLCATPEAGMFPRPDGVDVVVLPGVRKDADGGYAAAAWATDLDDVVALRRALLTSALEQFAPDLLVVDKAPWGFRGELAPALRALGDRGTRLVLGLRDVLDDTATTTRQWREDDGDRAVREHYDEVWVYGDRAVHDVTRAAGMAEDVAARCRWVGYLSEGRVDGAHRPPGVEGPYVLGVVGGGQDGAPLARAFAVAPVPAGTTAVLVTGPQLPDEELAALRTLSAGRDDLVVVRFSRHCASWAAGARAVVAMGGANTVSELLATDVPALVVPRVAPRREQEVRARGLAALGALEWLHPELLDAAEVGAWTARAVHERVDRTGLDLAGLSGAGRRAARLLGARGLALVA